MLSALNKVQIWGISNFTWDTAYVGHGIRVGQAGVLAIPVKKEFCIGTSVLVLTCQPCLGRSNIKVNIDLSQVGVDRNVFAQQEGR